METAIWDVCAELDEKNEPGLNVKKGFFALAPLEIIIFDPGHVLSHPHHGLDPVLLAKESSRHWHVRQQEEDSDRPRRCGASKDQEYGLHRTERTVNIWQRHGHFPTATTSLYLPGGNALGVADSVGHEAAYNTGQRVSEEPCRMPQGLFGAFIPHGNADREARAYGGLGDTQEKTHS